jgi:Tfp pilus assembly protein PilO
MMKIEFQVEKKIIVTILTVLMVADGIMTVYAIQIASAGHSPQQQLASQRAQLKLLKADIARAAGIQQSMPQIKSDCERFENSLLSTGAGYSAVSSELSEVGQNSGLQIDSLTFTSKDLPERSMAEIAMEVTVSGDYKSVVRFLNGLQRSQSHYVIDGLALTPGGAGPPGAAGPGGAPGALQVALHLRSYFRNAA